jgi:hypothetical protein
MKIITENRSYGEAGEGSAYMNELKYKQASFLTHKPCKRLTMIHAIRKALKDQSQHDQRQLRDYELGKAQAVLNSFNCGDFRLEDLCSTPD